MKNNNVQAVLVIVLFLILISTVIILLILNINRFNEIDKNLNGKNYVANQNTNVENNKNQESQQNTGVENNKNQELQQNTSAENNKNQELQQNTSAENNKKPDWSEIGNNNSNKVSNTTVSHSNSKNNISSTESLKETTNQLQQQIIAGYDNKTFAGMQVLSIAQQYITSSSVTVIITESDKSSIIATVGSKKIGNGELNFIGNHFEILTKDYEANKGKKHYNSFDELKQNTNIKSYDYYKSYVLRLAETKEWVRIVLVKNN